MPFGLLPPLAGRLIPPGVRRCDAQICDRPSVLGAADFRILAQVPHQNDLVDAARHDGSPLVRMSALPKYVLPNRSTTLALTPTAARSPRAFPQRSAGLTGLMACSLFVL